MDPYKCEFCNKISNCLPIDSYPGLFMDHFINLSKGSSLCSSCFNRWLVNTIVV